MIIAVLSAEQTIAARLTVDSVKELFPDAELVSLRTEELPEFRTFLQGSGDSFCLTLRAGVRLLPDFKSYLEQAVSSPQAACLDLWRMIRDREEAGEAGTEPDEGNEFDEGPYLWRTEMLAQTGFAGRDRLPFAAYIELELWNRLIAARRFSAQQVKVPVNSGWQDDRPKPPRWQNSHEERGFLIPMLKHQEVVPLDRPPLFSVFMILHNEAANVPWAIRSVINQSFRDWELLIVDDGSGDGTIEAIHTYLEEEYLVPLEPDNRRILILRNETNRGKSAGLNQALQAARGRWVVELDGDDWLGPDALMDLQQAADNSASERVLWYGDYVEWQEVSGGRLFYVGERRFEPPYTASRITAEGYPAAPRCYRTDVLHKLGGWAQSDPYGGRLYEDMHQLLRLSPEGPFGHIPRLLYHRRIRKGSITKRHSAEYRKWRAWAAAVYGETGPL
ncbi:hypothetical protein AWM70_19890 [Paenibacillus yonginensis]|uniref:Glycosyltransferase 2-like domain-containing protein n=1 Tax=Paenibacillus yonginensis TaxID=1462996 RepID=A0A1B1N533_9BACL|nr:glycosyltransferase [Paenibacillus yonginensis]ANS76558.1 hypothetical protein AWM70_19890 [Paenibacillus yonginensis]